MRALYRKPRTGGCASEITALAHHDRAMRRIGAPRQHP
jgi:hypothetical protein